MVNRGILLQGTEKVILMQEQLSKNRIIIDVDSHQQVTASVQSSTHEKKTQCGIVLKHGRFMLRQNSFASVPAHASPWGLLMIAIRSKMPLSLHSVLSVTNAAVVICCSNDAKTFDKVSGQPQVAAWWHVDANMRHWWYRDVVPVVVVMKAMGIESDQEVTQLIGSEGTYAGLFAPSLQECKQLGVYSQQQALEWLGACTALYIVSKPCLLPFSHLFLL